MGGINHRKSHLLLERRGKDGGTFPPRRFQLRQLFRFLGLFISADVQKLCD